MPSLSIANSLSFYSPAFYLNQQDQPKGSSSSSGGALFGIIMGVLIIFVTVLLVIGCFIFRGEQRFRNTARNHRGETQQDRQQNLCKQQVTGSNIGNNNRFQQKTPLDRTGDQNRSCEQKVTSSTIGNENSFVQKVTQQHRQQKQDFQAASVSPGSLHGTFTYEELKMATDNFSNTNLLGQGGFGYVHKGVLPNGKVVAIKQLKAGSGQGQREFQAEVQIISRVHHKHVVSLVGYCISGAQRLLVYEFVPNKTLEFHLHGDGKPTMDWPTRMKIALGSARGLAYLHEDCQPRIIHRDIKSANILIDKSFEAKVADFGLATYSLHTNTHVSTRVVGTVGYLAPEYAASGKLTEKSDVFSFGVLLLELITGFRPSDRNPSFDDDSMVDWAKPLLAQALEEGNFGPLVDQKLKDYDSTEMARMVACAAASVRHSARRRPRMSQIVRALAGNMPLEDLNDGITPGHSSVYGSYGSSEYNSIKYRKDMKKFRKAAPEIFDLGSSEFSGQTSDDGPNQSSSSTED